MVIGAHTHWCQTSNMDRTVSFYRDTLGLKPLVLTAYWSEFALGDQKIALHPALEQTTESLGTINRGWFVGIQVSDIKALNAELAAAGAELAGSYHDVPGGVVLSFADPDGNPIQAIQLGVKVADL